MRQTVTTTRLAARNPRLEGLRVLVVGLGRSGLAAARLLAARGARVTATDLKGEAELGPSAREARSLGAELRAGGHPPELAVRSDLIVVSPGVAADSPLLQAAAARGVPVWGEVELGARFCEGRIVGITGSNGKSTVTAMTGTILRAAGIPGGTGGNLGVPLTELLVEDGPEAVHAVELSSFQLETVESLRAAVAVIVNLSPDHLDRHASYEGYARAKARLLDLQDARDHAVLNADDAESTRFLAHMRGRLHRFSVRAPLPDGAFLLGGRLTIRTSLGAADVMDASRLTVPGEHNLANALAASLACHLVGCPAEVIARGLASFRALPHRLQHVATLDDVAFYDDSKATNLDAATRAIGSFPPGSVHVILGGRDKGADWRSLAPLLRARARRILLVGEAAPAIRAALEGAAPLVDCDTVPAAVRAGFEGARPGDVVLLAPGCASFDQYRNFEERGDDFRRAVESLLPGDGHDV